jgi:NNP family nitrate/nitrite transporter-like MFS transporter
MSVEKFNILAFTGKMKTLHLSWMAFFITFMVWFNMAPLKGAIVDGVGLTLSEWKTLLIINVALTIPARVIIGALTDKYGPRTVYSVLLAVCSIPCFVFALADSFTQLVIARFALGCIGAGFVVGIRMVSEWFPPQELGTAEGIYGGWGNFGSAAAAFTLPTLALLFGGEDGWRYAVGITGLMSLLFSVVYFKNTTDTPKGSTYFRPKNLGGMEVTSVSDFYLLLVMKTPMYLALALLNWKLSPQGVALLSENVALLMYIGLALLYVYDGFATYKVNKEIFVTPVEKIHQYQFKQVAVLNILYFATFGSELAVISMLPAFFAETFELSMATAGLLAGMYAFMNLMSRPGGGWLSDKFGRRKTLLILTAGLALGYWSLSLIDASWPIWLAVVAVMTCSFFVQSGEGAVFAAVPLIKRRLTGQIAGMTGAYGNVGAVVYLTVYSLVDTSTFFMVIACTAVLGFVTLLFMQEPSGKITEVREDGSVELIDVT